MFVEVDSPFEKVETTFTETITEQTTPQRGAEWLDDEVPGWANRIDLNNFDLSSCEICVCGYVFMDDAAEKEQEVNQDSDPLWEDEHWTGYDWFIHSYNESPGELGFQADSCEEYSELEEEWRELIAVRQS